MRRGSARCVAAVEATEVNMSVELGAAEVTAREVLQLKVGDLLTIETRADDPARGVRSKAFD